MGKTWKGITWIVAVLLVLILLYYMLTCLVYYGRIVLPFATKGEIVKEAVRLEDLEGKQYIICEWTLVTGYNYRIVQDENGNKPDDPYCWVTGFDINNELAHDFLVANTPSRNQFVIYYTEIRPYDFDNGASNEYIATGWDVLYPVSHANSMIYAPNYVLKSDYLY